MIETFGHSVGGDSVGVVLAAADTSSLFGSDSDVTRLTPGGSPRVSDDPVVNTICVTISNDSDSVVDLGWARSGVDDTTSVHREHVVTSSKGNSNNTVVDSSLVLRNRSSSDGLIAGNLNGSRTILTSLVLCLVWVLSLGSLTFLLEVVPSPEVPATAATMRSWVAINKLLLREVEKFTSCFPVSELSTSGTGEGPAGTTACLVLDGIDTALGSPVNCNSIVALVEDSWLHKLLWNGSETEPLVSLGISHGGEHVVTELERVLLLIPFVDHSILLLEEFESVFELISSTVRDSLGLEVGNELGFKFDNVFDLLFEVVESEDGSSFKEVHHI